MLRFKLAGPLLGAGMLLGAAALTAQQNADPFDPEQRMPAEALREDLGILRAALEEGHPGLYRYSSRVEIDAHLDRLAARIREPMTQREFLLVVWATLAGVNDGHTRSNGSEALVAHTEAQPIRLPFKLAFVAGNAYLHRNYSDIRDELPGARVESINGRTMEVIADDLIALLPSDGRVETSKYRRLEGTQTFGLLYNIRYGWTTQFDLELRFGNGMTRTVTVPGITLAQLNERAEGRYPELFVDQPPIELEYRDEIPILTVRTFGSGAYGQAGIDYGGFLQDAFEGFASRGVRDLIIDVRNNGGGSDEFGKMLFAYFADDEFRYYAALELNDYKFAFQRYTNDPDREFPEDRRRANDHGMYDVLGHPNLGPQQPLEPGFRGRVYVLQNGGSFSATGEFTSVLHQNYPDAVFVGEESGAGYYGNTSGASLILTLPNSGIRVSLPLMKYSMAVEGYTPTDRGLLADVEVEPTIEDVLTDRDAVLQHTLELIRRPR